MSFLKNLFGSPEKPIQTNEDFWQWFKTNEATFFKVVKAHKNIEKAFFNKLSPKLDELKEGYFFLAGMYDEHTAELVLTPDGNIKNIVFVEELVAAAPSLPNWKFTALKPALAISDVGISMGDYHFNSENIFFYSNDLEAYPDEIDISIIHKALTEDNKVLITNGTFIFLDNYLGELDFITKIDNVEVIGEAHAKEKLVPIGKLKDFLNWRQKEFQEKYEGKRYNTESDHYSLLESTLEGNVPVIAVINTDLLQWDSKASHPWVTIIEIAYDGKAHNGMPNESTNEALNKIEEDLQQSLKDFEGYLNIGRQTGNNIRTIFFACSDFRKPSKVLDQLKIENAQQFKIDFDIYRDKYWRSFNRFSVV